MLIASLILSGVFVISMCVLVMFSKGGASASPEYKQPDIHIHNNNNSHGGSSSSNSHGGTSSSNSDSDGYGGHSDSNTSSGSKSDSYCDSKSASRNNNSNPKTTTTTNISNEDNVSEETIKRELDAIRNELIRKQQLDMDVLEQLDRLDRMINK